MSKKDKSELQIQGEEGDGEIAEEKPLPCPLTPEVKQI